MGCPANDLVRLFASCLSGHDRQTYWEELAEEFYGYLKEEVDDMEMPYSLEQLKESYRRFMPIGGFLLVRSLGPLFDRLCKTSDVQLKQELLDNVTEKTECLLDDILYYHDRNQRLKKQELIA
ncbi:hypothetical protein OESDEN_08622 [Oesophagostomum dentatum]|uniref:Uncharacterized protein n=1 Tax=Oesophagostomum dentatum TaxID=61180 RepID=A0A0B1T6U2_OESDE|nr:hypothetical protein OESDEN_08622 [Oesophagostomum dentatum]